MSSLRTTYRHALEVTFGPTKKFRLLAASPRYYWTEVTVIDEKSPGIMLGGETVVCRYDGAHCVFRGYMEQFEECGGKRVVAIREVAVKWVAGAERMASIRREAGLYEKELKPLQGTVVPRFYGLFSGIIGDIEIGCMVMEFCNGPAIENKYELNRQRMLAGIALHKTGVRHCTILEPTHYLPMDDGSLRLVGFSSATLHDCPGATILARNLTGDDKPENTCTELEALESRFGVESDRHCTMVRRMHNIFPEFDCSFFYKY